MEIILLSTFIHMDKHLDGARGTLRIILKHFKWSHLAKKIMHELKSDIMSIF